MLRKIIEPGAVIGILGDGQLGRMTAIAAAQLGYRVAVLGPGGRDSPTGQVSWWAEAWSDGVQVGEEILDQFCRLVSVVLVEWENVPLALVDAIEKRGVFVCPGREALRISQDRLLEKELARSLGIPTAGCLAVGHDTIEQMPIAPEAFILKTRRDGYDGKGQVRLQRGMSFQKAWCELGSVPCILETVVDFAAEMSIIVARSSTQVVVYGPFENEHKDGILASTRYPSRHPLVVNAIVTGSADRYSRQLAEALDIHGLLAIEYFVSASGDVIFNEMAPRPHNSGHLTIECCITSQFEQYVRAACGLPLGRADFRSSGRMRNLIGDDASCPVRLLEESAALHLYGKGEARPGRKMGHQTFILD